MHDRRSILHGKACVLRTTKATRCCVSHQVKNRCAREWAIALVSRDRRSNRNAGSPVDDALAASSLDFTSDSPVNEVRHIVDHDGLTRKGIHVGSLTPRAVVGMSVVPTSLRRNDTIAYSLRPHVWPKFLLAGHCRIRVAGHIASVRSTCS